MPNLNYNRGRALEYRTRDHYRKEGWEVYRTAGSHSPADLICIRLFQLNSDDSFPEVLLVQCRGKRELMSKKGRQEFADYCNKLATQGILAYYEKRKLKLDVL